MDDVQQLAIGCWPIGAGLVVAIAWALDARLGEPRDAWHPVAWLGALLAGIGRRLLRRPPLTAFVYGAAAWLLVAGTLALAAAAAEHALAAVATLDGPWRWLATVLAACLLKPCFAWRMLRDEVSAIEPAIAQGLDAARARVARLASRDVSSLDAQTVRETAIETLAENLNDSLVAPLFWYAVAGLPGAVVYRFANTADAMWGYRGRWEWAGKWAAHADDLLSWVPARLTALLLAPHWLLGGARRWRRLRDQARQTPSPNGGWPMSAMALRLGVRLRKPGVYGLNACAPSPGPEHLDMALRLATRAAWVASVLAMATVAARCASRGLLT